jgi:protein XagA
LPGVAWAGAWSLPEGSGEWFATVTGTSATSYFSNTGLASTPRYSKEEMQFLIEYGITDRLTAIFDPGLLNINIAAPVNASHFGPDFTEFGARYAFLESQDWVVSGQTTLRVPGTTDISNPAAIGYTDVEADFRALLGHNFTVSALPAFFDFELAERWRTDGYPSEFRFEATVGVKIFPRWMILAQSFNVISEGPGISYFGGSYEYYKFQLSALYTFADTWTLQFGGVSTYAGGNAVQENGVILGVWHQF